MTGSLKLWSYFINDGILKRLLGNILVSVITFKESMVTFKDLKYHLQTIHLQLN